MCQVLEDAMDYVASGIKIPRAIAMTTGLKENLLMVFICTLSHIPLMIIGPPGTSKTLSVSLIGDNMKGKDSPGSYFRTHPTLELFHYQCSRCAHPKPQTLNSKP